MEPVTLFLLPFAGGSRRAYKEFSANLPHHIIPCPIELPGHGSRYKEKLLTSLDAMVDDIYEQVCHRVAHPYAIYGHSMGAVLGYLLVKKIISNDIDPPVHLFFTGRGGPSCRYKIHGLHKLPPDLFIERVKLYGGYFHNIPDSRKWLPLFEPVLKADFQAVESYCYKETQPFHVPLTIGIGTEDSITTEQAEEWRKETTAAFELVSFPGDHFFIFRNLPVLMQVIGKKLLTTI